MELAPFDVKVITIITGAIATPFFAALPPSTLPQNSRYRPIEPEYTALASKIPEGSMDPHEYARGVVANALKENSSVYYWRGGSALTVRVVTALLPVWFPVCRALYTWMMMDILLTSYLGLGIE
jgi:1-acylglycerone phosphate reductase